MLAMANIIIEGGMPFSKEDLQEATDHEGTLYDWLDAGEEKQSDTEPQTPQGDYDTLKKPS